VAQLREFHRRFYAAGVGEFAAVGDMDTAAVQRALESALGDWAQPAAGPLPWVRVPQPLVAVPPLRFLELTPDKANANLRGQLALPLSDRSPEYPALILAGNIFGQGADSRLWKRIRGKEGLSYDVRSGIAWSTQDDNSPFTLSAIFAPQNQAKVEAALQDELARSLKEGFTQAELDDARSGVLNGRRLNRAQDGVLAGALVSNPHLGRTFAISQQVDDALARTTLEQVNAAWRKYIVPQRLVLGWGGDFKAP
jgi:zinc protease